MDKFFDRLGDLLRSLLEGDSSTAGYYDLKDPDMQAATEELDEYLKNGGIPDEPETGFYRQRKDSQEHQSRAPEVDAGLRGDYATLEVSFAAPLREVRKSYKRLLHKYHPDRFSLEAEKQALATEVTQRLNAAFARIEAQYKKR
jgi:DnaJ-domain-containing protein 1